MITLDQLIEEWKKDCVIEDHDYDLQSNKIPSLHQKYITYLARSSIELHKLKNEKIKLENKLDDYFDGKIDGKAIGRPPFKLIVTKAKIEKLIAADDEFQNIINSVKECEEKVLYLKEIIGNINFRNNTIKNSIAWKQFVSGA